MNNLKRFYNAKVKFEDKWQTHIGHVVRIENNRLKVDIGDNQYILAQSHHLTIIS